MLKLFLLVCFSVNVFVNSSPLDNAVIEGRIIGGNDTDISKFPHHVAVYDYGKYSGGGFIVSPTHIITAAYCVYYKIGQIAISIRAGSSSNEEGGEVVKVKKVYNHPKFNFTTRDYDVAVLELETPLKINNKTIKPVKVGTKEPSVGSGVTFSGWGFINEHEDEPETLHSVTMPVMDRTKCATIFKAKNVTITPRMICAGGEGVHTRHGDYGGALLHKDEAVGIASYIMNYGPWIQRYGDLPPVFTNIADPEIMKFIKDTAKL